MGEVNVEKGWTGSNVYPFILADVQRKKSDDGLKILLMGGGEGSGR